MRPAAPTTLDWTDLDQQAVDTARLLAADAVQRVGNGHPGTAMSLAPVAYLLFQKIMRHNPADPAWVARDRFVLSAGHSSLTLYVQLFLGGFGLELSDLQALRTWGSQTPGHPEHGHTAGVETTTGPLGQGVGNAVGMAMAARRERGLFTEEAAETSIFDHQIFCIASDGDIEEGVASEASSLAATQRLGNLTVIYDANQISIEDDTDIALSEDVAARYEAYGWDVHRIDWSNGDTKYQEDVAGLFAALAAAREITDRPSLIQLRTIIGWPAPKLQNTGKAHGAALGEEEVAATKQALGFDPEQTFAVSEEVLAHTRALRKRGAQWQQEWEAQFTKWEAAQPDRAQLFHRLKSGKLPAGWAAELPQFPAGKEVSTRKASGQVLSALAAPLPELWGGSADLAESNNTTMEGEPSFLPSDRQTKMWPGGPSGRTLHFGIREHAMGAILNGIRLHGPTRPYGGTFLVFSDYMRPAVRLAALMKLGVTYVWTHDSIGLGEDGPTHQPIEHLAALRAIPGLDVVRPADANEVRVCWEQIISQPDRPAGLALSRQNLPVFPRASDGFAAAELAARGGYILKDFGDGEPQVILIGTGSEVQLAVAAAEQLIAAGTPARVVSLPCFEWFLAQDQEYRDEVIPPSLLARVSVEAGVSQGWREIVSDAGSIVAIDHFGASADQATLFTEFGFTPERVVAAAKRAISASTATKRAVPVGSTK